MHPRVLSYICVCEQDYSNKNKIVIFFSFLYLLFYNSSHLQLYKLQYLCNTASSVAQLTPDICRFKINTMTLKNSSLLEEPPCSIHYNDFQFPLFLISFPAESCKPKLCSSSRLFSAPVCT